MTLIHSDCLDALESMQPAAFDAVVTDPPGARGFLGLAWDGDRGGRDKWIAWLAERLDAARRVTKFGGWLVCWADPITCGWTHRAIEDAGWTHAPMIAHLFGDGPAPKPGRLGSGCHPWFLASNGPGRPLLTERWRLPSGRQPKNAMISDCDALDESAGPTSTTGRRSVLSRAAVVTGTRWGTSNHESTEYTDKGGASRYFPAVYAPRATRDERTAGGRIEPHPTGKSLRLVQHFVRLVCAPGERCLDPFAGHGSTLIACEAEGVESVGIEQDAAHVESTRVRLDLCR